MNSCDSPESNSVSISPDKTKLNSTQRFLIRDLALSHQAGTPVTMLTAYDYLIASILDGAGVDMLLVGDSLGNVNLGLSSTLPVTLEHIEIATTAVARAAKRALVIADLPFGSYESGPTQALESSVRLLKAGANAIKLEGGRTRVKQVKLLTEAGIPVFGHLGYTPQSDNLLSGPRLQARNPKAADLLIQDAATLAEAGAVAIVLEMVPADLAAKVTEVIDICTIGIGSGPHCNGQVLVWSDMAGMTQWTPSFAFRFAELGTALNMAATSYVESVKTARFPSLAHYQRK